MTGPAAGVHDRPGRRGLHLRTERRAAAPAGLAGARSRRLDDRGGGRAILPADGQPGSLSLRRDRSGRSPRSARAGSTSSAWASATPTCPRRPTSSRRCSARWPTRATIAIPSNWGLPEFARGGGLASTSAASACDIDPEHGVLAPAGRQGGPGPHLLVHCSTPGDLALVPDPGYPVYAGGSILVGAEVRYLPPPARERASCPIWTRSARRRPGGPRCSSSAIPTTPPPPWSRTTSSSAWWPSPRSTTSPWSTTTPTPNSPTTATWRPASWPPRAPRTWAWSSSASPSPST